MKFIVEGKLVAQQRHRNGTTKNGKQYMYTPKKTVDFKKKIQKEFEKERKRLGLDKPVFKKGEEVFLCVYAGKVIPKSYTKKKVNEILKYGRMPVTKPDVDNYEKIVMDALTNFAYEDDNQVSTSLTKKMYLQPKVKEKMVIEVKRDLPKEIIDKLNKGE